MPRSKKTGPGAARRDEQSSRCPFVVASCANSYASGSGSARACGGPEMVVRALSPTIGVAARLQRQQSVVFPAPRAAGDDYSARSIRAAAS